MIHTMLRSVMLAAILNGAVVFGADNHSAVDPAPRGDQWWKDRHESFNKKVGELGEKAEVIFIGDSITQGWEGAGKEVWAQSFEKYNPINLGIGGDRTQHVLWRLENGNLEGLKPKAAVVMIGTNNSNGEDNTVEQIADGVTAIVEKLREKLPETRILLIPIFPRGENPNPQRGKILQVNQIIQKLADGRSVLWVDFGHKFINEHGQIPRSLMPDFLHLSPEAYQIWADSIERPLQRVVTGEARGQREGRRGAGRQANSARQFAGEWTMTLPGPNNEPVDVPFTIEVEGNQLKGAFHAGRDLKIEDAKVTGNEASWTVTRNRPEGGTMTYKMTGTLSDGRIAGKASTQLEGQNVTVDWSARRRQP